MSQPKTLKAIAFCTASRNVTPIKAALQRKYLQHYRRKLGFQRLSYTHSQPVHQYLQINCKQVDSIIKVTRKASAIQSKYSNSRATSPMSNRNVEQNHMSDGQILRLNKSAKEAIAQFSQNNQADDCFRSSKNSIPKKLHHTGRLDERCSMKNSSNDSIEIPELFASSITKKESAFNMTMQSNQSNHPTSRGMSRTMHHLRESAKTRTKRAVVVPIIS